MGTVYTSLSAPSGGNYAATIERLSDSYYRQDDAEVFSSGLAFADKDITLTEGSGPNRGTYVTSLTATNWNDGVYRLRIHNKDISNRVDAVQDFGVIDGNEVTVGEATPIYHADINFTKDVSNSQDEYTVSWFKNAILITSGVTSPGISVYNRSDGSYLIDNKAMTEIGSTGFFKYDATTTTEQQTAGEACIVMASGIINGALRKFTWNLGRDSE